MEVTIARDNFLPVLMRVTGVVERKQTLPILANLLVRAEGDRLEIIGTDLEVEVRSVCRAVVGASGETTLPAKKILDIVRNLGEGSEVRIEEEDNRCKLTSGRGRYVLGSLSAAEFPVVHEDPEVKLGTEVRELELKKVLEKTAFAMAQQDVRYYLNGLLMEFRENRIRAVATDGHRLARYDLEVSTEFVDEASVIVPYKTVNELRRLLGNRDSLVRLVVGDRVIQFVFEEGMVTSKLVDGKYPDYERVIPITLSKKAIIKKEALKRSLVRAAVLSNEKYRGVRIAFEKGVLRLQAHNPEQEEAVEELELEYSGDAVAIGFNVAYLSDVLSVISEEKLEVSFEDENSSSIWRGVGSGMESFVVMPMRL